MQAVPEGEALPGPTDARAAARGARGALPAIDSRSLFRGVPELLIAHGGEHYRLRITRQGKLILTK